jgi:hypothetical protein
LTKSGKLWLTFRVNDDLLARMLTTKRALKHALGFSKDTQLAAFFAPITKQAIGAWAEDEEIPEGRKWEARAKRPDLFDADGNLLPPVTQQKAA